ncbi:retrotransposon protein, putative, ty1-copia subclass [Tanacetum coccineum]
MQGVGVIRVQMDMGDKEVIKQDLVAKVVMEVLGRLLGDMVVMSWSYPPLDFWWNALSFRGLVRLLVLWSEEVKYEKKLKFVEQPMTPAPDPETTDPATIDKYYESVSERTKKSAYDMLKELRTMFEEHAKQELFETIKAFHACKQYDGQSVSSYLLKMKSYLDTLERLGYAIPNELGVRLILNSLNKDYDQFIQNYNIHSMAKTIAELHAMLKLHDKGIPKKVETNVVLSIREGRIHKNKKIPQWVKGKDKGKTKLAYAPNPKILPPPKRDNPVKDSVCHHCKEVALDEELYILPYMHNLYPNVSTIYNVSNERAKHKLDSSYLWHCRLGHINKKRLDKLQRDGILQPTYNESLEKCKSCISRKMVWKPFPYQVERAKDLLGLIHTNVCDPFRTVSREDASYFITFTDDFSRFGYIYLMKHKYGVFETFNVFQNEVENQLSNKIKAIQSDRGGK